MNIAKGDVVQINLGALNKDIVGSEQANTRPCVVLQTFLHLELIVIIPLSTKKKEYLSSMDYPLDIGTGGLKQKSFARCHHIRTLSTDRIIRKIGTLGFHEFNSLVLVVKNTLF